MQTVTHLSLKEKSCIDKRDSTNFYRERYGVRLISGSKDLNSIEKSICKYQRVFNELVLVQEKFEKPGKFHHRKRQVSKLIGCDIHAKSWSDLSAKVYNLYFDFYKSKYSLCKKDIYNSIKVKLFIDSSKLEGVYYSSKEPAKNLNDLYLIYYKSEK